MSYGVSYGSFTLQGVDTVWLASSRTSMPTGIIMKIGDDDFVYVKVAKQKLNAWFKNHHPSEDKVASTLQIVFNKRSSTFAKYHEVLKAIPSIFSYSRIAKARLLSHLLTKEGVTQATLDHIFGETDSSQMETLKFGDARIIVPHNMQPNRKKQLAELLRNVKTAMSKHRLGWLVSGIFKAQKIKGTAVGYYIRHGNKSEIAINENRKSFDDGVSTIIHELGHKLYYEALKPEQHKLIEDTFKKLKRTDNKLPEVDEKGFAKRSQPYIGNKYPKTDYLPYLNNGKWYGVAFDFKKSGKVIGPFTEAEFRRDFDLTPINKWFVTGYARSSHEEFFSELFSHYILGLTGTIQAEWMKRIVGPYGR